MGQLYEKGTDSAVTLTPAATKGNRFTASEGRKRGAFEISGWLTFVRVIGMRLGQQISVKMLKET